MPLLALGVSYRMAPVALLERLAVGEDDLPKAYRKLRETEAVAGGVILSTCNRVEVFAEVESYHSGFQALKRFLAESRDLQIEEFSEPLYAHYEDDAAEHLFGVASGIDSMVLGEPQILAQVRAALRRAEAEGAASPLVTALFRAAVRAGKRARAETPIGAAPSAIVAAGADLAEEALGGLAGRSTVVVGAGPIAELAAMHLREREVGEIRIVNRSEERGRRLADRVSARAAGLQELVGALAEAELVVCSTGASRPVVHRSDVEEARGRGSEGGAGKSMFFLDLGVPRDVEPSVANVPGVKLVAIDHLRGPLEATAAGAGEAIAGVRAIVADEVERFALWRRSARLAPLIQALRERGDRIQAAELARVASRLQDLSDREREAVESMARGIVAKLLHDPIVKVKELSGPASGDSHARTLAEVFGIEFPPAT